jgi:hypothetical protein
METKFKVEDKVYWVDKSFNKKEGAVNSIEDEFIMVIDDKKKLHTFYLDGKYNDSDVTPRLSFTPYEIEFKGFSQERPLPNIEVDTVVYVRNGKTDLWDMRYFSHFENDEMVTFINQENSTVTGKLHNWKYWSLENPLISK